VNILFFYSLYVKNQILLENDELVNLTKRLTAEQKEEIAKSFESGIPINTLAKKHTCSNSTIIRNLKKYLGESKYRELFKNSKSLKAEIKVNKNKTNDFQNLNEDPNDSNIVNNNITSSNFTPNDSFFEIAPLDYEVDSSPRKELSSIPISEVDFPRVVFLVVDKKIELEVKLLKDFPEWEFLPDDDLNRKTIEIFFDLNLAKRSCKKEQKVLKVPNTDVFRITAPILISKGISRIVCAENLIAL